MNKKGSLNLSLENVIGLIIGSVLILGLIFFVASITELFVNNPEQGTLNNFDAVVITINQLVEAKGEKKVEGVRNVEILPNEKGELFADIAFYMQDDYGLIGFDKEKIEQTCGVFDPNLEKPANCLKVPCLCLAKIQWGLTKYGSVNNYENCETLKDIRYIYATQNLAFNLGEQHKETPGKNNLAMWSECGAQGSFKVRNIRLLKVLDGDNIDILFANVPEPK